MHPAGSIVILSDREFRRDYDARPDLDPAPEPEEPAASAEEDVQQATAYVAERYGATPALASSPPAEEASTDYASSHAYLSPEYSHRWVVFPESFVVVAGEYATDGEPDLIVEVVHAVDREGVEVSDHVSTLLARYIASAEFAAALDDSRRTLRRADVTPGRLTRAATVVADVPDQEG